VVRVLLVSKALIAGAYQRKAALLARMGVDLTVVVPPYWKDDAGRKAPLEQASLDEARPEGALADGEEGGGGGGYRLVVEPMALNGHFHTHFYPHLAARVREVRPQILHMDEEPYNLATAQAFWIARRAGARPLFFTWQNLVRRYPPPFRWMERYCYGVAAGALAGNGEAVEVLRRKGYRGPAWVVPHPSVGIDEGQFYCRAPKGEPAGGEGRERPFTVGFVGRLRPQKGAHLLVQAVGALGGDTRLELLGWGPEEGRLRALADEVGLGDRFAIHQALPSERVPEFLSRLDALVLPSLTFPNWKEQFGRALTEAMACEVPVVGSDSGEIARVIGDAGLVFPEGDVVALSACLRRLRDDPGLRRELAARGLARVRAAFTQEQIARQTLEVYREVLGQ
jgi:glycosyltransferase involved in cell wall biosynthesis